MKMLRRLADDTLEWVQEAWRKHLTHLWRMMHWVPPVFAAVTLWLFACNGQLREVYLALVEAHRWPQLMLGLASIGIISFALFTSYIELTGNRVLALYGSMSTVYLNRWLQRTRDALALAWAALPFLGLLYGLWQVRDSLPGATAYLSISALFAAIVLALLWRFRAGRHLANIARGVAVLVVVAVFVGGPLLEPPHRLMVTHGLGPLAMVGLQLVAILAIIAGLAALRRHLLSVLLAALVLGSFLASAPPPIDACASVHRAAEDAPQVVRAFKKWLAEREPEVRQFNGRFPVFIVAAQGGGIYAASATATFLAKLQEECPSFSRHVFAISGVSGGAVGAALYHAYADDRDVRPLSKCRTLPPRDPPHELMTDIRVALTRDHLTPVLGPLVPELALSLVSDGAHLLGLSDALDAILPASIGHGRARALEMSLACAHIDPDEAWSADDGCFQTGSRLRLRKSLSASWRDGKGPHALILNTTRAEAGSTVAFSPFGLADMGAPSIEAFVDEPYDRPADKNALAEAAVASARFPGVLPPYTLDQGGRTWNFVDGGYADDSGVAVAGAIYRALRDADAAGVDVRLILLTSDASEDAARTAVGTTSLVEFRVPLEAVLNVRAGIGTREVVRALNQFSDRASTGIDSRVFLMQFRTPFLGWMISKTTNDAIVPIVASRDPCPGATAQVQSERPARAAQKSTRELARENGCQLSYIRHLLRGGE